MTFKEVGPARAYCATNAARSVAPTFTESWFRIVARFILIELPGKGTWASTGPEVASAAVSMKRPHLRSIALFEALLPEEPCVVLDARRDVPFAGKIGQDVVDQLLVERGGSKFNVFVGRARSRFEGTFPEFEVGERIYVPGVPRWGSQYLLWHKIRRALVLVDTSAQGQIVFRPVEQTARQAQLAAPGRSRRTVAAAKQALLATRSA